MNGFRQRLYESYASTHAGTGDAVAARVLYRRDIRPRPPGAAGCPLVRALTWTPISGPLKLSLAAAAGAPQRDPVRGT